MKIPEEIQNRLTWSRRNDETWDRIETVVPVNPCACGITPQREPVYKISKNSNPFPHTRIHCDYCKRYTVAGTNTWFDTPHDINAHLRIKENYQKITKSEAKR